MTLALRPAGPDDRDQVYACNAAADVRAWSRDPRPIVYADHCAWFTIRLAARPPLWIVEVDHAPVGVVRIDAPGASPARISIALDATARGRGVGRRAIALACSTWSAPLVAEIHPANTASQRCFESCGFVPTGATDGFLVYHWFPTTTPRPR